MQKTTVRRQSLFKQFAQYYRLQATRRKPLSNENKQTEHSIRHSFVAAYFFSVNFGRNSTTFARLSNPLWAKRVKWISLQRQAMQSGGKKIYISYIKATIKAGKGMRTTRMMANGKNKNADLIIYTYVYIYDIYRYTWL